MKGIFLVLLALLLFAPPVAAQGPIYLPLIFGDGAPMINSPWRFISPEATTNKALNPSAETTGNYTALAGTTVTRSSTYQHYGLYSYRVETNADNEGMTLTLSALANAAHYVTMRVRGALPPAWDWSLDNAIYTQPKLLETINSDWRLYGLLFPDGQASGSTTLYIRQNGAGSGDFYVDGIQVEEKAYFTTYCDGTQPGCGWNGPAHAAYSSRSAQSRAGGRLVDLYTEYGFFATKVVGAGAPPQSLGVDSYAILPGGELNNIKIQARDFTLVGKFINATEEELSIKRRALLAALSDENIAGKQPLKLRYLGGRIQKDISVYYSGGLEGEAPIYYGNAEAGDDHWTSLALFTQPAALQFQAPDPAWYEVGESAAALDTNDTATFRYVAGRLKSTGQWSALGPPNAAGTYTIVYAMAEDATYLYIGGDFLNFDNIAAADYIVRYNKQTGVYSAMGTGADNSVRVILIGPNGDVYAGGAFTSMGGVANTAYIARWDGANWNALGTGANGGVYALLFRANGNLVAGGNFAQMGGVANTAYIAYWNGTAWNAYATGLAANVDALAELLDGTLIAAGSFGSPLYIAQWDGAAWVDLTTVTGPDAEVNALLVDPATGILYVAGDFDNDIGNRITAWNGTSYSPLGTGLSTSSAICLALGQDGMLYVGGDFPTAGGITLADRVARWNGYTWAHLDIDLPGTAVVMTLVASRYTDPVITQNYDLFLSLYGSGTGSYAGKTTVTNQGNIPAYPKVVFSRSGGTSATMATLKNETTGQELLFNYDLQNGETLTIDLAPTKKSIVSSSLGPKPGAVLANSDLGEWVLQPGANSVTGFAVIAGSPTVTAALLWRAAFRSYD